MRICPSIGDAYRYLQSVQTGRLLYNNCVITLTSHNDSILHFTCTHGSPASYFAVLRDTDNMKRMYNQLKITSLSPQNDADAIIEHLSELLEDESRWGELSYIDEAVFDADVTEKFMVLWQNCTQMELYLKCLLFEGR